MADATPAAGVPTFDASQIQGLLAQFGPTQAMKDLAMRQALMSAGFGLLGMVKGGEGQGAARAGLLGMGAYNDSLKQQLGMQQQGLAAAMPMFQLEMKQRFLNQLPGLISGQGQPGAQPTGNMPTTAGPPAQFSSGVNAGNAFGGGASPQPQSLPTQVPAPSAGQSVPFGGPLANRSSPTTAAIGAKMLFGQDITPALAYGDPNITVSRTGIVYRGNQLIGQVQPNGQGMTIFQGGDPTKPVFVPGDPKATIAAATQAGAIAKAQADAKALNLPPVEVPVRTGGNQPVPVRQFNLTPGAYGAPPPGAAPPPSAPTQQPAGGPYAMRTPGVFPPGTTNMAMPSDANARNLIATATRNGLPASVTVTGAQGAAPAAPQQQFGPQSTAAKAEATGVGENYAKQQEAVDKDAANATMQRGTIKPMLDALGNFTPNAAAPVRLKLAEAVQAIPGLGLTADSPIVKGIAGGDINSIQEFNKLAYGNSMANLRSMMGSGQRLTQTEILGNLVNQPNIGLQLYAVKTMLLLQDGTAHWLQDKQQAKQAWVQGGNSYNGFEPWWNRTHPLTGVDASGQPYVPTIEQVKAGAQAAGQATPGASAPASGWSITRIK